jgi:hypothetical protein
MHERGCISFMEGSGQGAYIGPSYAGRAYPSNSAPSASPQLKASRANGKRTDSAAYAVEKASQKRTARQGRATLWSGGKRLAGEWLAG